MPETDLSLLLTAAQRAGKIACQFVGPKAKRWDKPDGAGPVTEADLAVNRYLEDSLQAARPDYGWLSEESEDGSDRLACERVFVIDPIDGTRSFAEGSTTWAHSLAIVENRRPVAAVVYLPQRDLLFAAAVGEGATCNGAEIAVSAARGPHDARVLCAKANLAPDHWVDGEVPEVRRSHRPSIAYRLARVADGSYDAMLTFRPTWEWDIAAGDLILCEAGGAMSDRAGAPLLYNCASAQLNGVVAAHPELQSALLKRLIYAPNESTI